ncbi:Sporulation initiation inhibitor protein Soj [Caloramator mitchellensis]|uniref:Sporulation initiation inhibitor protein Soj n=1 Tax=Caloramator mitchellensis TaxID=908809 RepID=A0A0R3JS11_CALMK|nr:ParA family protein [Caloramator mitchellensis]KRQ85786.1 Sporulation initiation inhibitor protein Soj [Caloramator mitchellensis]
MNETTKETYIISFMNMKGGVGKTTLCVNLADAISRKFDKSVLLIDFDPQANSTQYILKPEIYREIYDSEKTVYRIYKALIEDNNRISLVDGNANDDYEECDEEDENIEDIIYKVSEKFHLIPGDLNMVKIGKIADVNIQMSLSRFIDRIKTKYDLIFIDCPPTHSIYTESALIASDYYILPIKPDYLSSIGMDLFQRIVKDHNSKSPFKRVKCLGIVFTMVHSIEYYRDTMNKIKERKKFSVFDSYMKFSPTVAKNTENNKFFLDIRGKKQEIIMLSSEMLRRIYNK